MKKVFLDTNIIIDLIADRKPFSKFAIAIFSAAENNQLKLFCSSLSIANIYYILQKNTEEKKLRVTLLQLLEYMEVIPVDADVLVKSLKSKNKDMEDAIQMNAAYTISNLYCIVTRNIKDFKHCHLPVLGPDEVVQQLNLTT